MIHVYNKKNLIKEIKNFRKSLKEANHNKFLKRRNSTNLK